MPKATIPCPECKPGNIHNYKYICEKDGVPWDIPHTGAQVIELTREAVSWRHDHPQSPVYPNERSRWVSEWEEGEGT